MTALSHREPDRVPFDLGGTVASGIHVTAYHRLRAHLGLAPVPTRIDDMIQQLAVIDEDMRASLDVDVRCVAPRSSAVYQLEVEDLGDYTAYYDEWGIGWRMPKQGGFYYDMFHHPLSDATTLEEIDRFPWPNPTDPRRFAGLRERAREAHERGEAVFLGGLCAGISEMAAWLRGFENYYVDLAANQDLLGRLMDKVVELKAAYWREALAAADGHADIIQEADDVAGQFGLLMSPATFRKLIKPRARELYAYIRRLADVKIWFHSCGAVREIIPDLIDISVDVLNPVQVSATGMDTAELKREFGRELSFWGGGVDTQRVLGEGTPDEVRAEVRRRVGDLAPGGGFVFATVHNTQANVPPENFAAMWEALREYGGY
jgi:uroporphyrinogen decarboxylase